MKFVALIILSMLLAPFSASAQQASGDSYVRLEASLTSVSLAPGDSTDILLTFIPADDIHLNSDPAVEILLDSASALRPAGTLRQEADARTGFLRTEKPLAMRVALATGTPPGKAWLEAMVTYFFCSGSEGWCMRRAEKVALPFDVRRREASRQ